MELVYNMQHSIHSHYDYDLDRQAAIDNRRITVTSAGLAKSGLSKVLLLGLNLSIPFL